MTHSEQQQSALKSEPSLDAGFDAPGPSLHIQAPQEPLPPPDDLPAWLQPSSNASDPAARWGRPLVAWGTTLAATAVMVTIGLWLGDHQESQNSLAVVANSSQAAAALPPEAGVGVQTPIPSKRDIGLPPLVLLPAAAGAASPAAPEAPVSAPALQTVQPVVQTAPPPAAQAAPAAPRKITAATNASAKQKVRPKLVATAKKPVPKRRTDAVLASAGPRLRAGTGMKEPLRQRWRERASTDEPAPRMRCRRGELARECLARYQ